MTIYITRTTMNVTTTTTTTTTATTTTATTLFSQVLPPPGPRSPHPRLRPNGRRRPPLLRPGQRRRSPFGVFRRRGRAVGRVRGGRAVGEGVHSAVPHSVPGEFSYRRVRALIFRRKTLTSFSDKKYFFIH